METWNALLNASSVAQRYKDLAERADRELSFVSNQIDKESTQGEDGIPLFGGWTAQ
jgi:3-deoxy-D-arabino-heptulosonate 7-phosphate (DAHP) synthase class II